MKIIIQDATRKEKAGVQENYTPQMITQQLNNSHPRKNSMDPPVLPKRFYHHHNINMVEI